MVRGTVTHTITLSSTSLWSGVNPHYNVAVDWTWPGSHSRPVDQLFLLAGSDGCGHLPVRQGQQGVQVFSIRLVLLLPCTHTYCLLQAAILLFKKEVLATDPSDQQMVVGLAAASSPT